MKCLRCHNSFRSKRSDALYCSARCRMADYRAKRNNHVTDNSEKTILSLCDYSGVWSQPYADAGYDVMRWDSKNGHDIRLMKLPDQSVYGILAAPPCTCFAKSGNRWKRSGKDMTEALSVVDACLRFVAVCNPHFWAVENPVGKLVHYLGKPSFYFNPCDYGDYKEAYTKRTCLWGKFQQTEAAQPD